MKATVAKHHERGFILITTLLLILVMTALVAAVSVAILSDTHFRGVDKSRTTAFYAAHAGLEKLTADLGGMFQTNFAPTGTQIHAAEDEPPTLEGIRFLTADGSSGYKVNFTVDSHGNPVSKAQTIQDGPFQGLLGQLTPYSIDVTARTVGGSDVHLNRSLQTVTIPLFQFGTFSDQDLGFHSGAVFNFGGRVHANGNLFLAGSSALTLQDKVTTAGEVIRTNLMNGFATSGTYDAAVNILKAPGKYRPMAMDEGSLIGDLGTGLNDKWTDISLGSKNGYNGNIRNSRTGAKRLDLPLITGWHLLR